MRFAKPPQLMTAEELADQVITCIQERMPESDSLDYKATLNIGNKQAERVELAKDVSSFANEFGGTLMYGVPEIEENGVPVPAPLADCGMEIIPGLPERVENILLGSIQPVLPNIFVKPIGIPGDRAKQILIVHHPASWNKPHMVEAYNVRRYFRRGNYRAVRMSEREVEAAYASRRSVRIASEEFFRTADLGSMPTDGRFLRVIVFPIFTLVRRETMREEEFRRWLTENAPQQRRGDNWVPFLDGVRSSATVSGALYGSQSELRYFHNGAVSFTFDLQQRLSGQGVLFLDLIETVINVEVLIPTAKFFELLGIVSPLVVKVEFHGCRQLKAFVSQRDSQYGREKGPSALSQDPTSFLEESSSDELLGESEKLLGRLMERLFAAFGLWRR